MGIKDYFKPLSIFKSAIEVKELRKQVQHLNHTVDDILSEHGDYDSTKGNQYKTYKTAVKETSSKYNGTAKWGNIQVGNIIDVRSAFIIGQGIKVESKGEKEFIEEFIKHNNLDEELPQDLCKEAEIDGRCLVRLIKNVDQKNIDIRFVSYSDYEYSVNTKADDYGTIENITWKKPNTSEVVTILPAEFVYKAFAGRLGKVHDMMPKVAKVLTQCENLDRALADWRKTNYLFSAPTPYFQTADKTEAEALYAWLKKINWKIGKVLTSKAIFSYVGITTTGLESLEKEITILAKVISGATGVPVHFLGFPDLMSNRAVSTDLFESLNASCNKERRIWSGFYQELIEKAIQLRNTGLQLKDPALTGESANKSTLDIKVQILNFTEAQLKLLIDVWLPLYQANIIDIDYMLKMIPNADPQKIKTALDLKNKTMLKGIQDMEQDSLDKKDEEEE